MSIEEKKNEIEELRKKLGIPVDDKYFNILNDYDKRDYLYRYSVNEKEKKVHPGRDTQFESFLDRIKNTEKDKREVQRILNINEDYFYKLSVYDREKFLKVSKAEIEFMNSNRKYCNLEAFNKRLHECEKKYNFDISKLENSDFILDAIKCSLDLKGNNSSPYDISEMDIKPIFDENKSLIGVNVVASRKYSLNGEDFWLNNKLPHQIYVNNSYTNETTNNRGNTINVIKVKDLEVKLTPKDMKGIDKRDSLTGIPMDEYVGRIHEGETYYKSEDVPKKGSYGDVGPIPGSLGYLYNIDHYCVEESSALSFIINQKQHFTDIGIITLDVISKMTENGLVQDFHDEKKGKTR